ncbi:hypothetical protein [Bacillus suaedaesalsae]|uniref:Lipoprotein n=1 Tax=Bacillus suaedaesalsae TaxID=2810349 RepID=A0ABS2DLT2_9BACI|nr:hypothetical protein [Bacillus suaedaesalsae]MBM6619444.1 hypothetical protein [Bacillus suaedaesalsae]
MKRFIIAIFLILSVSGCTFKVNDHKKIPEDFNFSLSYGVNGINRIDTFEGKVVKDLINNGKIEADIVLTRDEMQQIYEKMNELDIMKKFNVKKEKGCGVEPSNLSKWTIHMNGETNSFYYMSYCDPPKRIIALYELENYIHEMAVNKEEYKRLPKAEGGYE